MEFTLQDEYPSLFRGLPGGESLFIEREHEVISHVGLMKKRFKHPKFQMEIGLIGSVVTRKENRGEGLASQLVQEALKRLKNNGCTLALLWSNQSDFYLPLGFHRAGNEWDFRISVEKARTSKTCCRLLNKEKDIKALWRLYQARTAKLERSLEEMTALVNIPLTQIYVTEQDDQIDSYIAINKGADFTHYIHEWGGSIEAVKKNIQDCQRRFFPEVPLTLIAPFEKECEGFSDISESYWKGSLGLVKILDRAHLLECFKSFQNINDQGMTDKEVLFSVLGKDGESSGSSLPLFLWGFDSI